MESITRFSGKYRFLSNFYPAKVTAFGIEAPTSEHLYQALKTNDVQEREWILSSKTPGESKRRGRRVKLRPDWETVKFRLMVDVQQAKFEDPKLLNQWNHPEPVLLIASQDHAKLIPFSKVSGSRLKWELEDIEKKRKEREKKWVEVIFNLQ